MKLSLKERCEWMRERQLALRLQRKAHKPQPRRLRLHWSLGPRKRYVGHSHPTCACGTCRKCKHREFVRQRREQGYLTRLEKLNAPLDRCPVWQRLRLAA